MENDKQKKLEAVKDAMEFIIKEKAEKENLKAEIYVIKDNCNADVKEVLMNLIYSDNGITGMIERNYEIVARSIELFCDIDTILDLENEGDNCEAEIASVYTNERLSYLDLNNESEIMEILKDYSCDSINLACAIWYDNQIRMAYNTLKDFILAD